MQEASKTRRFSRGSIAVLSGFAILTVACGSSPVEIVAYTTPAEPGQTVIVTARAAPASLCGITLGYDGEPSRPAELPQLAADDAGFVSWEWAFDATTEPQSVTASGAGALDGETKLDSKRIDVRWEFRRPL